MKRLTLTIDDQRFEFPELNPDYDRLTTAQAETLRLLIALAHLNRSITTALLVELLGLKSPLPLQSRLQNLGNKQLLLVAQPVAA